VETAEKPQTPYNRGTARRKEDQMRKAFVVAASALAAVMPWTLTTTAAHAQDSLSGREPPPIEPAADGPRFEMLTDDGDPGGKVEFWPVGDVVSVLDEQSDGKGVEIDVWNVTRDPDTKEYGFTNTAGEGIGEMVWASLDPRYNLAEGDCFRFRIRLVDNGEVVSGSTDNAQWRNYNDTKQECPDVE
jgi:hypothetical protein